MRNVTGIHWIMQARIQLGLQYLLYKSTVTNDIKSLSRHRKIVHSRSWHSACMAAIGSIPYLILMYTMAAVNSELYQSNSALRVILLLEVDRDSEFTCIIEFAGKQCLHPNCCTRWYECTLKECPKSQIGIIHRKYMSKTYTLSQRTLQRMKQSETTYSTGL